MSAPKYRHPMLGAKIGARTVASTETRRGSSGSILWLVRCPADHSQWVDASKLAHGEAESCAECTRVAQEAKRAERKSVSCALASRLSSTQAPRQVALVADRLERERRAVALGEVAAWLGVEPRRALRYLQRCVTDGRARHIPGGVRAPDRWVSVLVVEPEPEREEVAA
jgi:hypothetical protein